jgi:hypothetical protein
MDDWKAYFDANKGSVITWRYGREDGGFNIEDLYQAFNARMEAERNADQPDAALMTADERRLEDYMAMWRGTRDRLQRVLAAIRRCEVSHTGMSYGDEKSGDVTGYTRGWGDCLKAVKKAVSTADQQSLPRMRCPECGKPYVRVETDYGPGEHADCACLDAPADKPSDA